MLRFAVMAKLFENGNDNISAAETAIMFTAYKTGCSKRNWRNSIPHEIPFDSERKLMTTGTVSTENIVIVKGAFDVLCKSALPAMCSPGVNMPTK